jgi:UDP-N-acetylenolpyruvoylglucosamine reductase
LINPQRASSTDVLAWSGWVQQQVEDLFGLALEVEPRFWS